MPSPPDFWGFLQQQVARLDEEAARVESQTEMDALQARWLDPVKGILERIKSDPFFSLAKTNAQDIFMRMLRSRVELVKKEWQEVWKSLSES